MVVATFTLPSAEALHADLSYCPKTGVLTRKPRPRSDFSSNMKYMSWNNQYGGKPAGSTKNKYVMIRIKDTNLRVGAHRVIWKMVTGRDPTGYIDHINRDKKDNRFENLRDATWAQNIHNQGANAANRSGYKGVGFHKSTGLWRARICINRVQLHLGVFDTPEAAHLAYVNAARKHHGQFGYLD